MNNSIIKSLLFNKLKEKFGCFMFLNKWNRQNLSYKFNEQKKKSQNDHVNDLIAGNTFLSSINVKFLIQIYKKVYFYSLV